MRILLDTHVFLWMISGDSRLPRAVSEVIEDFSNEVFLSVASVWEAVIKHQRGRLPLPAPAEVFLPLMRQRHQIRSLAIDEESVARLGAVPILHRDPFDRILVAQALQHELSIATIDDRMRQYPGVSFVS